ncbi:conserved hypothetical protein [Ricinus communis]|uniref:Uncharacterized protein n=1 Tax=Ricinus communis TaxID=3988 RepID=B9S9H6_RICCO|nr:conserved hypothetical protein [Ricinus communis]
MYVPLIGGGSKSVEMGSDLLLTGDGAESVNVGLDTPLIGVGGVRNNLVDLGSGLGVTGTEGDGGNIAFTDLPA